MALSGERERAFYVLHCDDDNDKNAQQQKKRTNNEHLTIIEC